MMSMCNLLLCCWKRVSVMTSVFSSKTLLTFARLHSVLHVYLWLIHIELWQKTTKLWKVIILQKKQKQNRTKANRILPRECNGHSKHAFPTTQGKTTHMVITRWSIIKSDWLYSLQTKMEKLYRVSKNKTGSWLWLRSWTPYCQIQTEIEESRENH